MARESKVDDDDDENADADADASLQWSGGDLDVNNDKDDDGEGLEGLDKIVTYFRITVPQDVCRIFDSVYIRYHTKHTIPYYVLNERPFLWRVPQSRLSPCLARYVRLFFFKPGYEVLAGEKTRAGQTACPSKVIL